MMCVISKRLVTDRLGRVLPVFGLICILTMSVVVHIHLEMKMIPKRRLLTREHQDMTSQTLLRQGSTDQCQETFNASLEDNLRVIENYPRGHADKYLWKIGGNKTLPDKMAPFPVIVTALDNVYYKYSQGMFLSIHSKLMLHNEGVRLIVYDLGLSQRQLKILRRICKCELRPFPWDEFPPHVRVLRTYAFKPILIQKSLMEFGHIWWMDSSIKFSTDNIDPAIEYAKNNSLLFFVTTDNKDAASITKHTDIRTFEFLNEDVCKFRHFGETWAGTVLLRFDRITKVIVKAWASCALNEDCMAPVGTENKISCPKDSAKDGQCHRFDQSVFSILLRRVFHEQNMYPLDNKLRDLIIILRRDIIDYFEVCRNKRDCN